MHKSFNMTVVLTFTSLKSNKNEFRCLTCWQIKAVNRDTIDKNKSGINGSVDTWILSLRLA